MRLNVLFRDMRLVCRVSRNIKLSWVSSAGAAVFDSCQIRLLQEHPSNSHSVFVQVDTAGNQKEDETIPG